jgi:hypothetical protein
MDLMSMVFTFAIILLISLWKTMRGWSMWQRSKGSLPRYGILNTNCLKPSILESSIESSQQVVRIFAFNNESERDLLACYFNYCKEKNVKPLRVEFGCVYVKNDKLKTSSATRLLKGVIERGNNGPAGTDQQGD